MNDAWYQRNIPQHDTILRNAKLQLKENHTCLTTKKQENFRFKLRQAVSSNLIQHSHYLLSWVRVYDVLEAKKEGLKTIILYNAPSRQITYSNVLPYLRYQCSQGCSKF